MTNGNSAERDRFEAWWQTTNLGERDQAWRGWLARSKNDHEFKNFHRQLCERFGYVHDEVDWKRDRVSLIEWIAKQVCADGGKGEAVAWISPKEFKVLMHNARASVSPTGMKDDEETIPFYTTPQAECTPRADAETIENLIGNLLARIHRDGGHYQADHGTIEAIKAAEREVVKLRADAEKDAALTDDEIADVAQKIYGERACRKDLAFARAILAANKETKS